MNTHARSIAKSVTWRLVGVVILGVIAYAVTRNWAATTGITVIFHSVRLVLYYFHERLWERARRGRIAHPLSHLPVRRNLSEEDHASIRKFLEEQQYTLND